MQNSSAIDELLDRDVQVDAISESTKHFAQEKQRDKRGSDSAVIFRIGAEWLALVTSAFDEVADPGIIHSLPHQKSAVVIGLTNVRGELLICISLAHVLGIETPVESDRTKHRTTQRRAVVIHNEGKRIVFLADEVHGTQYFDPKELQAVPATVAKATASHTKAMLPWRDKAVGFLDDQLLFYALNRGLV